MVHVANHHIAPGKKQWTWGNHEFGYAWDRNLTDHDGPYIELMAGVYTDNQPDFSYLAPWETKTFTQNWYPIHGIGAPVAANVDAALSRHRPSGAQRDRSLCDETCQLGGHRFEVPRYRTREMESRRSIATIPLSSNRPFHPASTPRPRRRCVRRRTHPR